MKCVLDEQESATEKRNKEREEMLYRSELRQYLDTALSKAPHGDIVRRRYFQGQTGPGIAAELGKSVSRVYQQEKECLRWLRSGPCTRELMRFNFYNSTSFQAFKNNGASVEELYLLKQEAWRPKRDRH